MQYLRPVGGGPSGKTWPWGLSQRGAGSCGGALAELVGRGGGERGPAGAVLELLVGLERGRAAQAAAVGAGLLVVDEDAAEGGFGAVAEQDVGLLARQARLEPLTLLGRGRVKVEA